MINICVFKSPEKHGLSWIRNISTDHFFCVPWLLLGRSIDLRPRPGWRVQLEAGRPLEPRDDMSYHVSAVMPSRLVDSTIG